MNDRHAYFILIDKDVELADYINVYNIQDRSFAGSWDEPPYDDIRYETEVDEELRQKVHFVNYGYGVGYDEELEEEVLNFSIDNNRYWCVPLENCDDEFDFFVQYFNYAYPIDSELDGWWDTEEEARAALEAYIERVAWNKVEDYLNNY